MTNLFDGLFLYEVILMLLGSVLFLVVIFLIVKQKDINKNHLMGIGLSILMIAFPGIKSFSIQDGIINIEKNLEELKENPDDSATKKTLEQEVGTIGDRPVKSSRNLTTLSEANLELGKTQKAETLAKEALDKAPGNVQAAEVVNVIEVDKSIEEIKSNPNNKEAKEKLHRKIDKLKKIRTESGRRTSHIAAGYDALGDEVMVKAYIDSTRMYQPQHPIIRKYENKEPLVPKSRE